jgi:hypothetical protein
MTRAGIVAETVVIEHGGQLIDYFDDRHPYRRIEKPAAWEKATAATEAAVALRRSAGGKGRG